MTIVVAQGDSGYKLVEGRTRTVVPYVGADSADEFASFGVGFHFNNEPGGSFWGLVAPQLLIQSWRAMKLFERLPVVRDNTLCACWYVANRKLHGSDQHYLDDLQAQFATFCDWTLAEFEAFRSQVLDAVPTTDELDQMLTVIRDKGVSVSAYELANLVERGALPAHPIIDELVRRELLR